MSESSPCQVIQHAKTSSEVVRYDNRLNEVSFSTLTSLEINIFFMAIAAVIEHGSAEVSLDYAQIAESANLPKTNPAYIFSVLQSAREKICALNLRNLSNEELYDDTIWLFSRWRNSGKDKRLTIVFSPYYAWLINGIKKRFTAFELKELVCLKSKVSKSLYVQLKQWKTAGRFSMTIAQAREKFGISESCPDRNIYSKYILSAVHEIQTQCNDFYNLIVQTLKTGKNHRLSGFRFSWDATELQMSTDESSEEDVILFALDHEMITKAEYDRLTGEFCQADVDAVIGEIMTDRQTGSLNTADISFRLRKRTAETALQDSAFSPPTSRLTDSLGSYLNMRTMMHTPLSGEALKAAIRELERLSDHDPDAAAAILDRAIAGRWKTFYPLPARSEKDADYDLLEKWRRA